LPPEQELLSNDSEGEEDTAMEDMDLTAAGDDGRCEGNRGMETRNCQSLNFLSAAVPFPETQFLAPKPKLFLLGLQTACDQILASRDEHPISQFIDTIQGQIDFVGKITAPDDSLDSIATRCLGMITAPDDSLDSIATRCRTAECNVSINDFIYMISTINLRAGILR
jgi:hypothetical protein